MVAIFSSDYINLSEDWLDYQFHFLKICEKMYSLPY